MDQILYRQFPSNKVRERRHKSQIKLVKVSKRSCRRTEKQVSIVITWIKPVADQISKRDFTQSQWWYPPTEREDFYNI